MAGLKKGQTNSGQFKKGQSGNPAGGPKLPPDLRELMRNTSNELKQQICEVVKMTVGEIQDIDGAPPKSMPIFKAAMISLLNNSLQSGDDRGIRLVMDRILGKVPEAPPMDDSEDETKDDSKDTVISQLVDLIVKEKR